MSLANWFLIHHEQNWLGSFPLEYRPLYHGRYVDDIFVLFKSSDPLKRFQNYLNFRHVNMPFTIAIETEQNNKMSFLDANIISEQGKFVKYVYRKPTFSGVYTHSDSLLLDTYKIGIIYTLVDR